MGTGISVKEHYQKKTHVGDTVIRYGVPHHATGYDEVGDLVLRPDIHTGYDLDVTRTQIKKEEHSGTPRKVTLGPKGISVFLMPKESKPLDFTTHFYGGNPLWSEDD